MRFLPLAFVAALGAALPTSARAQTLAEDLAAGDSLHDALQPAAALARFKAALAIDSTNYEALWKAGRSAVDIAKQIQSNADSARHLRDSIYQSAREFGERAIRADSMGADGHFVLALALGRLSRTKGGKDRVRFARIIYDEAARALALDPNHDGAEHILGAWHAEVKRLSGLTRFFAKTFLGAGFMRIAKWDSAAAHLERAVALKPSYLYHHLELGEIYRDMKRYPEAREQLEDVLRLPPTSDVNDSLYKEEAQRVLNDIRDKK